MTATANPLTFGVAVVSKHLDDAQRLAQAIDAVSGRGDLVRPLEVLCNAAVAGRVGDPLGVALVIGRADVQPSDFLFVKAGEA